MLELIKEPWPWYIAGPLVGLTVPALLLLGNKSFGISSTMRHICAACIPAKIPFFQYDWKKETWNLVFVFGIFLGALVGVTLLGNSEPIVIDPLLRADLAKNGITEINGLLPEQLFSWNSLMTVKGFIMIVIGGLMVGFGTRYAGGCTSGHSIMGLSALQWPSLVATICFMIGGILMSNFILPYILKL